MIRALFDHHVPTLHGMFEHVRRQAYSPEYLFDVLALFGPTEPGVSNFFSKASPHETLCAAMPKMFPH